MKRDLVLGLLTGILFALSFPPFRTGFLAYGALIPFFLLLQGKSAVEALRWGYVTGLFADIAVLFWIGWVTLPGLLGALLILPLFFALYSIGHWFIIRRLSLAGHFLLPFLWTAVEYLQSFGETAFPWNYLGYTQTYYLPLIQHAEYTSVYGVSFWVVLINVMLFVLWQKAPSTGARRALLYSLAAVFFVPLLHGALVMRTGTTGGDVIRVALLQGNVDPFEKWDANFYDRNFEVYEQQSKLTMSQRPDLLIWPETAMPFYLRHEYKYLDKVRSLVDSLRTPLLTGTIDFDYDEGGDYRYYNSALLFEPFNRRIQSYAKMQLVPFSERVPYRNYFPFNVLKNLLYDMALGIGDYSKGDEFNVLKFTPARYYRSPEESGENRPRPSYRLAAPICYESAFPNLIRQFARQGIDFLAVITNDAWFGKTSAPYQHEQIAVMRAIENRTPIARCANTGVSCFIDPFGRVSKATKIFQKTQLVGEVHIRRGTSFYTRHGNVFANCVSIIAVLAVIAAVFRRAKPGVLN